MTFAATGSWLFSDSAALTVSNQGVGDLLIVGVYNYSNNTVWATSLSGGGATWTLAGVHFAGTTNNQSMTMFLGKVTATGAGTVTPAWSGTAPSGYQMAGHEFTTTLGSWTFDQQGNLDSPETLNMPSLTPAVNGELYFGFAGSFQTVVGSTTGYVYNSDNDGNGEAYKLSCAAGTATFPVWGGTAGSNGLTLGMSVLIKEGSGAAPAPYPAQRQVVRARIPNRLRLAGVYMGIGSHIAARDGSFGTGQVQWGAGGPVVNPQPGPVFTQKTQPVRSRIPQNRAGGVWMGVGPNDTSFGTGQVQWSKGAPVQNPAPGPVFRQRTTPVRFIIPPLVPRAGRIGTSFTVQVQLPVHGPPVYPLQGPVRAKLPQPVLRGRSAFNAGAPVKNPAPGPVFAQKTSPAKARQPLPARGRVYRSALLPAVIPPKPVPLYPLTSPVRAKLPPVSRGRMAALWGGPVQNVVTGPVFRQATSPARIRVTLPPRGRIAFNKGAPVHNPQSGPVFTQKTSPARVHPSLPPRGRIAFGKGAAAAPATSGPVFRQRAFVKAQLPLPRRGICRAIKPYPGQTQPVPVVAPSPLHSPVMARFPLPPKGRIGSNSGAPVHNPSSGPAIPPRGYPAGIRVIYLATGRGQATPLPIVTLPTSGPVFVQRSFVRAQLPLPRRGTCRSIKGYPAQTQPTTGAPFACKTSPVQARFPLVPRGRVYSNPGVPVQAAGPAAPFRGITSPVRSHPVLPPRGRIGFNSGAPVVNPHPGPVFRQATAPARIRITQPPRGRIAFNPGGPVRIMTVGPVFIQKPYPAQARIPQNGPRGRVYFNAGGPVHNPKPGPVFIQAVHPAQARIPQVWSKGRVYSNPGGPVENPTTPGPLYPLKTPVRIHPQLPPRGRIISGRGGPVLNPVIPVPVYPLHGPVRAAQPLPARGRIGSNPGVVVPPPTPGPKVYPLKGPVQARRPLPPRGRVALGNKGAPVQNPAPGPVFRQAVRPIRAVIPQNAPRGRTASNPGGPVENIPNRPVSFTYGTPYFDWEYGTPYFDWEYGTPTS